MSLGLQWYLSRLCSIVRSPPSSTSSQDQQPWPLSYCCTNQIESSAGCIIQPGQICSSYSCYNAHDSVFVSFPHVRPSLLCLPPPSTELPLLLLLLHPTQPLSDIRTDRLRALPTRQHHLTKSTLEPIPLPPPPAGETHNPSTSTRQPASTVILTFTLRARLHYVTKPCDMDT